MSDNKLNFSEFEKTDFKDWKEKVIADLKGKDYSILTTQTDEEIDIHAIIESKQYEVGTPNSAPYLRGNSTEGNDWTVFQSFNNSNSKQLNSEILKALNKGVSGINLELENYDDLNQILNQVQTEYIYTSFDVKSFEEASELIDKLPPKTNGWINFNPLKKDSVVGIDEVLNHSRKRPEFKGFNIDGSYVRNQGGTIIDEIVYLLSCGNEYLNHFKDTGVELHLVTENILFSTGIGPNYFFEIAKIRAIRALWANIVSQYKPENEEDCKIHIHGKTMTLNIYSDDPYNNLLRQTTEAMSAAIGGVNSLEVVPFKSNDEDENILFSRMAKNIQLILKEESMLNQVVDPAGGSYYIEALTEEISKKAWKRFQEMEAKGGFIEQFDEFMTSLVAKKTDYISKVESGERIRVGVNKYQLEKA